jgi:hypothetical protein
VCLNVQKDLTKKQKCADQNILMPGCLCVYENIDTLYDVIVIHIKRMVTSCEKINLRQLFHLNEKLSKKTVLLTLSEFSILNFKK